MEFLVSSGACNIAAGSMLANYPDTFGGPLSGRLNGALERAHQRRPKRHFVGTIGGTDKNYRQNEMYAPSSIDNGLAAAYVRFVCVITHRIQRVLRARFSFSCCNDNLFGFRACLLCLFHLRGLMRRYRSLHTTQ